MISRFCDWVFSADSWFSVITLFALAVAFVTIVIVIIAALTKPGTEAYYAKCEGASGKVVLLGDGRRACLEKSVVIEIK